jgi:ABC-type sugar transport system substrate-binding protein
MAVVAVGGLLAACGGGSSGGDASSTTAPEPTNGETTSAAPAPEPDEDILIGVSFYTERIPLYAEMRRGVEEAAAAAGVEVVIADANGNAETQTNQIANMVTQGVDAIIASPVDATAMVPAYQGARDAGVIMISAANKVADEYEDAFVGPDLVDYAAQTMTRMIEGIGGSGKIMIITGPPQISFVQLQQAGWDSVLAEYPDVEVVATGVVEDLTTAKALDVATSLLTANPDVNGIMSSTDNISVGVIQAIEGQGLDPATIFTAGWDAQPNAVELIREGKYTLSLSFVGVEWGRIAFATALESAKGNLPASHYVSTPGLFVDAENASVLTENQISGQDPL